MWAAGQECLPRRKISDAINTAVALKAGIGLCTLRFPWSILMHNTSLDLVLTFSSQASSASSRGRFHFAGASGHAFGPLSFRVSDARHFTEGFIKKLNIG